jgi:hypothetical protein
MFNRQEKAALHHDLKLTVRDLCGSVERRKGKGVCVAHIRKEESHIPRVSLIIKTTYEVEEADRTLTVKKSSKGELKATKGPRLVLHDRFNRTDAFLHESTECIARHPRPFREG